MQYFFNFSTIEELFEASVKLGYQDYLKNLLEDAARQEIIAESEEIGTYQAKTTIEATEEFTDWISKVKIGGEFLFENLKAREL